MTPAKTLAAALDAFLVLIAVSVVHRFLAFGALAGPVPLLSPEGLRSLLVGTLSDVWVCCLLSWVILLVSGALNIFDYAGLARIASVGMVALLAVLAAMHQAYVEFFQFQIIPFHLRYLGDFRFLAANGISVVNLASGLILVTLVVTGIAVLKADLFGKAGTGRLILAFFSLSILSLYAHNRNIHYRVQWFIPENLQVNALERLYMHLKTERLPDELAPAEVTGLASLLGSDLRQFSSPIAPHEFFHLLTRPSAEAAPPRPIAIAARGAVAEAVAAKQKPVVMILLLESLRPSETGYFAPDKGPSLTPALDQLAAHGIAFMHAFSTGSVTRGAQEATFCGYLGSRDTSLMRGEGLAKLTCLPDLVRAGPTRTGARGDTFWYHGGDERFDGQVAYWRLHGVHDILSLKDFPVDAPRTGWGVGDRLYLRTAAARLAELRDKTPADFLLGMGLTVTNHIPWDLPADAGPETKVPRTGGHWSYSTTAYTDAALGDFVAALKEKGLWQNLLLVLASDHGNNLPPLVDLYPGSDEKSRMLQSHINLVLSGGLTDKALQSQGVSTMRIDDLVSQADIASFVGYVLDMPEARFMGQNLLKQGRALPVLSDLEEDLYDHSSDHVFSRTEIVKGDATKLPPAQRKALLYYRAFLQYIYSPP